MKKHYLVRKQKKMGGQKFFGKKNVGPQKFQAKKLGKKKIGSTIIFGKKKYWVKNRLDQNDFESKKKLRKKSVVKIGSVTDIADMDKCHNDECCVDKCHQDC